MYDAKAYMQELTERLQTAFQKRLIYVGLQGSYLRGEMTEESDIDPMVVIDGLDATDLKIYREIVGRMEQPEKSCGFICGKKQMASWNPMEIMHLLHSTKDLYGVLEELVPSYTREDALNYCKIGLNNLYHFLCHRYIHGTEEHNAADLPGDYKMAFFLLQDLHCLRTGRFVQSVKELAEALEGEEKKIVQRYLDFKGGSCVDAEKDFQLLFRWCSQTMSAL